MVKRLLDNRRGRVAFMLMLTLSLVVPLLALHRLCEQPLDVSGNTRLPEWLMEVKERDEFAYPLHVALGTMLCWIRCEPTASGVQWLKAAAHARTPEDVARAAAGLRQASQRFTTPQVLADQLCSYVPRGFARPAQQ